MEVISEIQNDKDKKRKNIRTVIIVVVAVVAAVIIGSIVFGKELLNKPEFTPDFETISEQELNALDSLMIDRGIGIAVTAELLYDHKDKPVFLLGSSDGGYMILNRVTSKVMEYGEGSDPYKEYVGEKRYYGGIMCYYVARDGRYYNLVHEAFSDRVGYIRKTDTKMPKDGVLGLATSDEWKGQLLAQ